jgi:hypothetical protein
LIRSTIAPPQRRRPPPPRSPSARQPIPLRVLPPKTTSHASPNAIAKQLTGRGYLSHSAISTYQRCPLKYFFAYVIGAQPEFKSSSLIFGGAIHAAIEHHFRCLLEGDSTPPLDELLASFDRAWSQDATMPIRYGKNESAESLRDLAERMLAAFQAHEVSNLDTSTRLIGVEEELRGPIIADCPDILGRLDLVAADQATLRITDFKTSRSKWNATQVEDAMPQQLLYTDLVRPLADALDCKTIEIAWIVITKAKQPVVEQHTLVPDPKRIARVKAIVRRVWHAIRNEHFYPSPSAMNCSTCPHLTACRKWED